MLFRSANVPSGYTGPEFSMEDNDLMVSKSDDNTKFSISEGNLEVEETE